jgi:Ca-activated chloride channel family protein
MVSRAAAALGLALALSGVAGAASRPRSAERPKSARLAETARVRMVLLEASVTDRHGRVVRGLDERDFRLFEDQVRQDIAFFAAGSEEPLAVAFLLDVSGSMEFRLASAKYAIRTLVHGLRPADRFALACFADERVAWATEFTQDREEFLERLEQLDAHGRSAIVDALAATPHLVDDRVATRKAIVLITDGTDNASRTPVAEAVEMARRVNVPVFTIAFLASDPAALPAGSIERRTASLEAVSDVTGGRVFAVHETADLAAALALLRDELSFQYLLGYYTEDQARPGEFQEIRLTLGNRSLHARTRSGYYTRP